MFSFVQITQQIEEALLNPKHTAAHSRSSRLSFPLLETIDNEDQTGELAVSP
jgi:hypothetical protein